MKKLLTVALMAAGATAYVLGKKFKAEREAQQEEVKFLTIDQDGETHVDLENTTADDENVEEPLFFQDFHKPNLIQEPSVENNDLLDGFEVHTQNQPVTESFPTEETRSSLFGDYNFSTRVNGDVAPSFPNKSIVSEKIEEQTSVQEEPKIITKSPFMNMDSFEELVQKTTPSLTELNQEEVTYDEEEFEFPSIHEPTFDRPSNFTQPTTPMHKEVVTATVEKPIVETKVEEAHSTIDPINPLVRSVLQSYPHLSEKIVLNVLQSADRLKTELQNGDNINIFHYANFSRIEDMVEFTGKMRTEGYRIQGSGQEGTLLIMNEITVNESNVLSEVFEVAEQVGIHNGEYTVYNIQQL